MEQLGDHQVRDRVVDRRAEEDDPLGEETRIDVVRALAPVRLLDDGRDEVVADRVAHEWDSSIDTVSGSSVSGSSANGSVAFGSSTLDAGGSASAESTSADSSGVGERSTGFPSSSRTV